MKTQLLYLSFLPVLLIAYSSVKNITGISTTITPVYKDYKIDSSYKLQASVVNLIKPYSTRTYQQISAVIGETEIPLFRKTAEGTLGNLVTDAVLRHATLSYNKTIAAAFGNSGGLRLNDCKMACSR